VDAWWDGPRVVRFMRRLGRWAASCYSTSEARAAPIPCSGWPADDRAVDGDIGVVMDAAGSQRAARVVPLCPAQCGREGRPIISEGPHVCVVRARDVSR